MTAQRSTTMQWLSLGLLFMLCLLTTDALIPLFYGNATDLVRSDTTDSNPAKLVVSTGLLAAAAGLLFWRPHLALKLAVPGWLVVVLLLLPFLSLGWSLDKATTFKRAMAHGLTILFAYYVVTYWRPETFLRVALAALATGCVASDILGVVWPAMSVNHDIHSGNIGAWVGVYGDKIMSGGISAATVLLAVVIPAKTTPQQLLRWVAIGSGLALCALSQSRTGWLVVALGLVMLGMAALLSLPSVTRTLKLAVVITLGVVVGGGLLVSFPYLLPLLGRTPTFSGRTNLWHGAISVAETRNVWLGTGFRAFWTPVNSIEVRPYIAYWEYLVGNAHNGYLDSWLELGWLGVAVLTVFLLTTLVGLTERILTQPRAWRWRGLLMLVLCFVFTNTSYSLAFRHTTLFWAGCAIAYLYVVHSRLQERWAKAAKPARIRRVSVPAPTAPALPAAAGASPVGATRA